MVYAPNNALLYNAVFSAVMSSVGCAYDATAADYDAAIAVANAIAFEVDAQITTDSGITDSKAQLMYALCAKFAGALPGSVTAADYNAIAVGISTAYGEAIASLYT